MKHLRTLAQALVVLVVVAAADAQPIDPNALTPEAYDRELERRFQYGPPQPKPAEFPDRRDGAADHGRAECDHDRAAPLRGQFRLLSTERHDAALRPLAG